MNHAVSTWAWAFLLTLLAGVEIGYWIGVKNSPSYHDAIVIERRLREVFCEQAVYNGLMKTCDGGAVK